MLTASPATANGVIAVGASMNSQLPGFILTVSNGKKDILNIRKFCLSFYFHDIAYNVKKMFVCVNSNIVLFTLYKQTTNNSLSYYCQSADFFQSILTN